MNLRLLSDEKLLAETAGLVQKERILVTSLLHHFREIQRRRLFSAKHKKSMYDFLVSEYGYSEDQAYDRITAMELLDELPELQEKIESGELTLSHIKAAKTHFNHEEKFLNEDLTRDEKLEVLEQISDSSVREAKRTLVSIASAPPQLKHDQVKPIANDKIELRFAGSRDLLEKIEVLKGRLAHTYPKISLGELFEMLCDLGLEAWDQSTKQKTKQSRNTKPKPSSKQRRKSVTSRKSRSAHPAISPESTSSPMQPPSTNHAPSKNPPPCTNPLSYAEIRRQLFQRAGNRCEKCRSNYALEEDHIIPRSKGGKSDLENMRVLCRSCNQRAAIDEFGLPKMHPFINPEARH